LINTSRAEMIEEGMLQSKAENFSGIGLNIFRQPLENGRIYYKPHIAGLTNEASRRMRDTIIEEIRSLTGETEIKKNK
jgi:phosphoglycerate dehydrogenase-like enzyme